MDFANTNTNLNPDGTPKTLDQVYMESIEKPQEKNPLTAEVSKQENNPEVIDDRGFEQPTDQAKELEGLLESAGEMDGTIIDASAGMGGNTAYFAEKGFNVEAVASDPNSKSALENSVGEYVTEQKVNVMNERADVVVKNAEPGSVSAVIDFGMSQYMNGNDKSNFINATHAALKDGGLLTVMHFADGQGAHPFAKSQEDMRSLYSQFEETSSTWKLTKWKEPGTGIEYPVWTAILKKPGKLEEKAEKPPLSEKVVASLYEYISNPLITFSNKDELKDIIREFAEIRIHLDNPKMEGYIDSIAELKIENPFMEEKEFIEKCLEISNT